MSDIYEKYLFVSDFRGEAWGSGIGTHQGMYDLSQNEDVFLIALWCFDVMCARDVLLKLQIYCQMTLQDRVTTVIQKNLGSHPLADNCCVNSENTFLRNFH